jgi:nucleotide-binding universal stress UspA family protein
MTVDHMRILVATDGSTGAGHAVRLLASSFDPSGVATVEIMAVTHQLQDRPGIEADRASQAFLEQWHRDTATQHVHEAGNLLRAAGFETIETTCAGHAADAITAHAAVEQHDLIVLGTRGLSGLRRRVIGSVSGKVARYAETSVLVARTGGPIRRILLGYDASPDADEALEMVARLPLKGQPQAIVCSAFDVIRPLSAGLAPTMVAQVRVAYRDSLRWAHEAADAMAASAAERLRARGIPATTRAVQGPAHEQLAVLASETGADLLVVGSRGYSAIQRFFLGSTSAAIVTHPPTSVVVARRTAA